SDMCDIVSKFPDIFISGSTVTPQSYCHVEGAWLTQAKFLAAYTVPKIDLLVSGTYQSLPGPQVAAFFTATSAVVRPSLGRDLAAGSNQTVSVNLIPQTVQLAPGPITAGTV